MRVKYPKWAAILPILTKRQPQSITGWKNKMKTNIKFLLLLSLLVFTSCKDDKKADDNKSDNEKGSADDASDSQSSKANKAVNKQSK